MADTTIIDGKAVAEALRTRVEDAVMSLTKDYGLIPGLAVVLVGEDPASQVYVRNKKKQTVEVGMISFDHQLDTNTPEADLLDLIDKLNNDSSVHGILVQLPMPDHIDAEKVIDAIDPTKDVDGFHTINVGRLSTGKEGMVPCTPLGCLRPCYCPWLPCNSTAPLVAPSAMWRVRCFVQRLFRSWALYRACQLPIRHRPHLSGSWPHCPLRHCLLPAPFIRLPFRAPSSRRPHAPTSHETLPRQHHPHPPSRFPAVKIIE